MPTQGSTRIPGTIEKFTADDYPVTNQMLAEALNNPSPDPKQGGQTRSYDKSWFRNDTLLQALVFELYTDYHRFITYHFITNDIPPDLINRLVLHTIDGGLASDMQKSADLDGFVQGAPAINSSYFVTHKGFRLGDPRQKAMDTYGSPDRQVITEGIETLEWEFTGDAVYDDNADLNGKPLASHSFGHQIIMYYRKGQLIGQILYNEIP